MPRTRTDLDFYQAAKEALSEEATKLRQQIRRGEASGSDPGVMVTLLESRLEERFRDILYPDGEPEPIPFG